MLRSSVVAEKAGVRTVSVVCTGFLGQANALARLSGLDAIAIAEYSGHVSSDGPEEFASRVSTEIVDRVIEGLVGEQTR